MVEAVVGLAWTRAPSSAGLARRCRATTTRSPGRITRSSGVRPERAGPALEVVVEGLTGLERRREREDRPRRWRAPRSRPCVRVAGLEDHRLALRGTRDVRAARRRRSARRGGGAACCRVGSRKHPDSAGRAGTRRPRRSPTAPAPGRRTRRPGRSGCRSRSARRGRSSRPAPGCAAGDDVRATQRPRLRSSEANRRARLNGRVERTSSRCPRGRG